MSLKLFDILFFGPVKIQNYEYKKNKKPSLIILVHKEGKNYDPVFNAVHILKANNENINIEEYINNKKINLDFKIASIFIREYDYDLMSKLDKDYELIFNTMSNKGNLLMSY